MFRLTVVFLTVGDSGESPLVSGVLVDRGLTYSQLIAVRVRLCLVLADRVVCASSVWTWTVNTDCLKGVLQTCRNG